MANPASVYCGEQGGTLEIRTGEDGGQTGYCVFSDGSECEEWKYFRGECYPGSTNFSQSVISLCQDERDNWKDCKPDDRCMDGFNADCYFDSTLYRKESLETGINFPKETKEACFAIHSTSACQCTNNFQLRKNGELTKLNCEEFYQAIEDKNKSCDGCINTISAGCC
jgi:hypothetical protein